MILPPVFLRRGPVERERDGQQREPVLEHGTQSADIDGITEKAALVGRGSRDAMIAVHDITEFLASVAAQ